MPGHTRFHIVIIIFHVIVNIHQFATSAAFFRRSFASIEWIASSVILKRSCRGVASPSSRRSCTLLRLCNRRHHLSVPSLSPAFACCKNRPSHLNTEFHRLRYFRLKGIQRLRVTMAQSSVVEGDVLKRPRLDDDEIEFVNSVLLKSIKTASSHCPNFSDSKYQSSRNDVTLDIALDQALDLMQYLNKQANEFCFEETNQRKSVGDSSIATEDCDARVIENDMNSRIRILAKQAIRTSHSLHQLVHRADFRRYPSKSSKSGVHAWKALQAVVSSSFEVDSLPSPAQSATAADSSTELLRSSRSLAWLALGITLSGKTVVEVSPDAETTKKTTKMIASAVIPKHVMNVLKGATMMKANKKEPILPEYDVNEENRFIYFISSCTVIEMLHLAARENEGVDVSVLLQVASKLVNGFGLGGHHAETLSEDGGGELSKAVSIVLNRVFGWKATDSSSCNHSNNNHGMSLDSGRTDGINNDIAAPALALAARIPVWDFINPNALINVAAEMDLWCSAELICDATVDAVTKSTEKETPPKEQKSQTLDTIAHISTRAIIDIASDYRLYRRADAFATKYYDFGGPERYADARFLHACDTIAKLVKKKQFQIIEKQVERVDEAVARVKNDLVPNDFEKSATRRDNCGEEICIDSMSVYIREFALRRLREGNQLTVAVRLAGLWQMDYEHDSDQLLQEAKKRKLTYLQWDDNGCPGFNPDGNENAPKPLPDLITEPSKLLESFRTLEDDPGRTIGFDAEWGDSKGVAVLQLSTLNQTLLLDIPALTSTGEGRKALKYSVGRLFIGQTKVRNLIGFGCKEDFCRLRASSVGNDHWFPQNRDRLIATDLRHVIAETNPELGGRGGLHVGLSKACEFFLGKQLDKAEQCSDWSSRPLSAEQREYAALDAWACAAIHNKLADAYPLNNMYIKR
mmetsp:Transcript_24127/g.50926  ORF Transcript_24127/g.50926 Transcript_24127/m.50926 type:complete len:919 (-) Transcript_24127:97-2853(-)